MRRPITLLATSALVLASCASDDTETDDTETTTSAVTADTETTTSAVEPEPAAEPEPEPESATEPEPEPAAEAEPEPDPEPVSEPLVGAGPYAVGIETITITDDTRDRPLTVDVWFPLADGAAVDGAAFRYTFITGDYFESDSAVGAGSASISTDGPFPLVVYSHGSGGIRYLHSDYTETLASHGYVVAAPDHTGNTSVEQFLGTEVPREQIALDRPLDVIAVIDAMTDPESAETTGYPAAVDPDRIAVTGHSFGGFTSYAVVSGYENDLGASPADDRVDAIIPLAPAVGGSEPPTLLTDEVLALVDVPALVMVGTDDSTTPVDPNVTRAWELTTSSPHHRVELVAAEHQSFTDVCDYLAAFDAGQEVTEPVRDTIEAFAVEGCSAGDMPIARVQELTNSFAVTFLDTVFGDGEMYSPDQFAGSADIVFQSK